MYPSRMDPTNPVVKLCVEGMEAEANGNNVQAHALFLNAWKHSTDDFERCIAAHYVARHTTCPADSLHWNQKALDHAARVEFDKVSELYASLHLNVGKSHEDLGNLQTAKRHYGMAFDALTRVPSGGYREIVQDGIERALNRVNGSVEPCVKLITIKQ
jgi:hypothetical protein